MRSCSRLNSFAAPLGRSSVQGLLRIRLTRSSHANVTLSTALATTPFMDATAISTHRFAYAATMRSSGTSETIRRNALACPTKPSNLKLMPAPLPVHTSLLQRGLPMRSQSSSVPRRCGLMSQQWILDATTTSDDTAPMKSRIQPLKQWRQQSGITTALSKTPSHSHPHLSSPLCSRLQEDQDLPPQDSSSGSAAHTPT